LLVTEAIEAHELACFLLTGFAVAVQQLGLDPLVLVLGGWIGKKGTNPTGGRPPTMPPRSGWFVVWLLRQSCLKGMAWRLAITGG
jgi:hypothetical protein